MKPHIETIQDPRLATFRPSKKLARRWRALYPRLGRLHFSGGHLALEPFSEDHLAAKAAEAVEEDLASGARRLALKTGAALGLSLFVALGCHAFGLALWMLVLAGWEAWDTCTLIDASA